MDHINWQRRRDILISIICMGIILWVVWNIAGKFFDTIIIMLLSMAIAFLLSPLVNVLMGYKVPRVLATVIVYVVVLAFLGAIGYALTFSLIQQALSFSHTITTFTNSVPDKFSKLITLLQNQANAAGIPSANITNAVNQLTGQISSFASNLASNIVNLVFFVAGALINIVLVIVISFYLTVDGKRIRDGIISIVPKHSMPNALLFEDALNRVVGNYIRGQLTLALIIGVLAASVCVVTGLGQYALIVGFMAFLFETIPMVGPTLASVPPIVLSLLLPDAFPRTFWIIGAFIVIQALESNILGPRIVGHAVGLHPVASILALIVGARLFGAFGALLATPVVAAAWVVIASLYRSARGQTADEMLARRRAPWNIRRPSGALIHSRNRPDTASSGNGEGLGTLPRATIPLDAEEQPKEQTEDRDDIHERTPSQ